MRLFILLLLFVTSLCGDEDSLPFTNIDVRAMAIVEGVNVTSCCLYDVEIDLTIPSLQPLTFTHSYTIPSRYSSPKKHPSKLGHEQRVSVSVKDKHKVVGFLHEEESSGRSHYKGRINGDVSKSCSMVDASCLTNITRDYIGGKTNASNQKMQFFRPPPFILVFDNGRFSLKPNPEFTRVEFRKGDGSLTRLTLGGKQETDMKKHTKNEFYIPLDIRYPNWYTTAYKHNNEDLTLTQSDSKDKAFYSLSVEKLKLTKEEKEAQENEGKKTVDFIKIIKTPDGREVKYAWKKERFKEPSDHLLTVHRKRNNLHYLQKVERPNAPSIEYLYDKDDWCGMPLLTEKKIDDTHYVRYAYVSKTPRIHQVWLPDSVGNPTRTYQFDWMSIRDGPYYRGGRCCVHDAYDNITEYIWNNHNLLTSITSNDETGIESRENLTWKELGTTKLNHLASHSLTDRTDTLLYKHDYDYDDRGNILKDTFTGALTGRHVHDTLSKTYTYSNDGINNVLSESDGRTTTCYIYLPGTNLAMSSLKEYQGKIIKREFFIYDPMHALGCRIEDDGCSNNKDDLTNVTVRKITRYKNREEMPCYGLPEEIEEKALNLQTGKEELHLKKKLSYTPEGWLEKEEVFDASSQSVYIKTYNYHPFGKPEQEVDPLGYLTTKIYDSVGNLIRKEKEGLITTYTYDNRGHITSQEVDGHEELYRYDRQGRKFLSINEFGHHTYYKYDQRHRQTHIVHPDEAEAKTLYNPEGHPRITTDEEGAVTETIFNCYKKPLCITKSDGSITQHFYQLQGNLEETIHPDGTSTRYTYDGLDHLIAEDLYSPDGALLSHQEKKYQGFNLIEETDPCGKVTKYTYDCSGRKISQQCEDSLTTYSYDLLGRLAEERQHLPGDYLSHKSYYDLLDRVIEEKWEDSKGNLFRYAAKTYDPFGNVITETNGDSTIYLEYDSLNRLIKTTDPIGNITSFNYGSEARDGHLLKTLTTINPNGLITHELYNLRDKVQERTVTSPCGETLYTETISYDKCARPLHTTRTLPNGETHHTKITYNALGEQIAYTQAAGTNDESTIHTAYNNRGNITTTTKPDGTTLHYTYNFLQQVHSLESSDGSVRYLFEHDICGRLLSSHDVNTGKTLTRSYDIQGHLLKEILPNGHCVEYTYDPLGRRITVTVDQEKTIRYTHDPCYLRQVDYKEHSYHYHNYDLAGRLLEADTLHLKRDNAGRITSYQSGNWTATDIQYDPCNNLTSYLHQDTLYNFSYDDLSQLTEENDHHYTYNAFHNRLEKDGAHFHYNAQHQNLLHTYDPNGNLLFDGTHHYTYDALDRLITLDNTLITYDSLHRRMTKGDTAYLYMGECEIGSTNGEFRVLGLGKLAEAGASVFIEWNNTLSIPSHDLQGSLVELNSLTTHFTAYGEGICPFPWGYQGKRYDPENNTYFFGRRSYDPSTGRWTTKDPAKDGFNHYTFVLNNPLAKFDAFGLYIEGRSYGPDPFAFLWRFAFSFIENIGNHLIPLPGFSNLIGGIGRLGQTGSFDWHPSSYHHSTYRQIGGQNDSPNHHTIYFNGMNCTYNEAVEQAMERSQELKQPVWLCYTATHGFTQDLAGCLLQKVGIPLQCDHVSSQMFKFLSENETSETPIHAMAFSRGTLTCDNGAKTLDVEYRRNFVTAQSVGGAIRFKKEDYKHTMNYESPRDWVTWAFKPHTKFAETMGWAVPPDNVRILECHATGWGRLFEHAVVSPSYVPAWSDVGENVNTWK